MNEYSTTDRPLDPQALDRLVDGELEGRERRNLLASLDSRPGGWRQCALAFLESQSWGHSLTEYVRRPTVESTVSD